jgi:hypothetical protein
MCVPLLHTLELYMLRRERRPPRWLCEQAAWWLQYDAWGKSVIRGV